MVNRDSGWRPKGASEAFGNYDAWEYNVGPHEINEGEVDGEIHFGDFLEDDEEFPTSVDDLQDDE